MSLEIVRAIAWGEQVGRVNVPDSVRSKMRNHAVPLDVDQIECRDDGALVMRNAIETPGWVHPDTVKWRLYDGIAAAKQEGGGDGE